MSSIFVSYRSLDYDNGVAALYDRLVALYGPTNVTLDRESFLPGATWLPQILSHVAMSEIVLCVIGPSWISSKERATSGDAVDYVAEELALAKKLGKPILPISINVEISEVLKIIPSELSWLSNLHFFKFDVLANDIGADIGASINKLSGIMPVGHSDRSATISARMKLATLYALRSIVGCVLNPTRYAAAALQSTHSSLWQSVLLGLVSLLPLSLSGALVLGQLGIFAMAKMLVLIIITASLFFVNFFLLSKQTNSHPSILSLTSFSIHSAAVLNIVIGIWALLLWIFLPDTVQNKFISITNADGFTLYKIEALISDLTTWSKAVLAIFQWGLFIHFAYVIFGLARAGTIVLQWTRWKLLFSLLPIVITFLGLIFYLLFSDDGLKNGKLPQTVKLSWLPDRMDSEGIHRSPFIFQLEGTIEKQEKYIVLKVLRFIAENRAQPKIEIQSLMCALGVLNAGKFEWPTVMHEGRVWIKQELDTNQSIQRDRIEVRVPLSDQFKSGLTAINCYVQYPTGSYPIGNGQHNILLRD
jgi:TIR domain